MAIGDYAASGASATLSFRLPFATSSLRAYGRGHGRTSCDSSVVSAPLARPIESVTSNTHVRFALGCFLFLFFPLFFLSPPVTRGTDGVGRRRWRVAQLQRPGSARIATNAPENVARENVTEKEERERERSVPFYAEVT